MTLRILKFIRSIGVNSQLRLYSIEQNLKSIIKMPSYNPEIIEKARKANIVFVDLDQVVQDTDNPYLQYIASHYRSLGDPKEVAKVFYNIARHTIHRPVSSELIHHLSHISNHTIVVGFTARSPHFRKETAKHVREVGMKFTTNVPELAQHPNFYKGIISMGNNPYLNDSYISKGEAMLEVIKYFNTKIRSIFFIDDSLNNLESVIQHLNQSIEYMGVHYTEAEAMRLNLTASQISVIRSELHKLILEGYSKSASDTSETQTTQATDTAATGAHTDSEIIIEQYGNRSSNSDNIHKKAPIINTSYKVISIINEKDNGISEYDETNTTHISKIIAKHYEETYGDLKFSFDGDIKELELSTKDVSSKEDHDDSCNISYIPTWLSSLLSQKDPEATIEFEDNIRIDLTSYVLGGIALLGSHALHHHEAHANEAAIA